MIDVIMNEGILCRAHCFFDGMQLLRNFQTRTVRPQHFDDGPQVPFCSLEAFHDVGMRLMSVYVFHGWHSILIGRIRSRRQVSLDVSLSGG